LSRVVRWRSRSSLVLLADGDRQIAVVGLVAQRVQRARHVTELGLALHEARGRLGEVALEPDADLVELPDLALLGQHAGPLRVHRAARHHAALVDDVAVERDHRLLDSPLVQLDRPFERVDDDRVGEQALGQAVVARVEVDQVGHGAHHALAPIAGGDHVAAVLVGEGEGERGRRDLGAHHRHERRAARRRVLEVLDRARADVV
jgi:hypothetical protein